MKIILLAYKNRSGSTYLANLLDKHPSICSTPEGGILVELIMRLEDPVESFPDIYKKIITGLSDTSSKLSSWKLHIEDNFDYWKTKTGFELFGYILNQFRKQVDPKAEFVLFKHPKIISALHKISAKFLEKNKIYILCLVRDGRAVFSSSKRSRQSTSNLMMELDPIQSAKDWNSFMNSTKLFNAQNLACFKMMKYEDLISNQKLQLIHLSQFLNLSSFEFGQNSSFASRISNAQKHLHKSLSYIPDKTKIHSWKNELSHSEIAIFEKLAGKNLAYSGYALLGYNISSLRYVLRCILSLSHRLKFKLKRNT